MKSRKTRVILVALIWLGLFSAGFWALDTASFIRLFTKLSDAKFLSVKLSLYVTYAMMLGAVYFYFFYYRKWDLSRGVCGVYILPLVFVATALTPTVLQTDQIRYVWDGLVSLVGHNPYLTPPIEHDFFSLFLGSQHLNHSDLRTIYPPFAQVLFLASVYLNPFMWDLYLGVELLPFYEIKNHFQLEFGWKMTCGLMAVVVVWVFRKKRWDKLIFHPLFLMTWVGNGHVDVLICAFMGLAVYGSYRGLIRYNFFMAAIFSKWLPILFFPAFLLSQFRQKAAAGSRNVLLGIISTAAWLGLLYYYWQGSEGYMFSSSKAYAKDWYFFGYFHHFIRDIFSVFFESGRVLSQWLLSLDESLYWNGIPNWFVYKLYSAHLPTLAKYTSLSLAALLLSYLFLIFYSQKLSLKLYILLSVFVLLAFFPTVHPWYLLILLVAWLPYHKVFFSPPLWAALILSSKLFYIDREELTLMRYAVYGIVSFAAYKDLKLLAPRFRMQHAKQAMTNWRKLLRS